MKRGVVVSALSGTHNLEAAGAGPVDMLTNQRWLIAPRKAVDHAGFPRVPCQQGTGQRIRFHVHHDNVPAILDGHEAMADAGWGIAGRIDDDFDSVGTNQGVGIVTDACRPTRHCFGERGGRDLLRGPAGAEACISGAIDVQIRYACDVQAARQARLDQKHRTELPRPNQANPHGIPSLGAGRQHRAEIQ